MRNRVLLLNAMLLVAAGSASHPAAAPTAGQSMPTPVEILRDPDAAVYADLDSYGAHEFSFTRAIYSSGWGRFRGMSWATDYPKADRQLVTLLRRLTHLDVRDAEHAMRLDDPALRRYPFLYALEVGRMSLTESEVEGLRGYLLAGGFLLIDDFWGTAEWSNFEAEMQRVLPGYPIVDLPLDHPVFSTVYRIDELLQVPQVGNAVWGGPTWERDGYVPAARGVLDEQGRLMVAINWNTDLGDAWEWAEHPAYPLKYSTFAVQLCVNYIVYAMSH